MKDDIKIPTMGESITTAIVSQIFTPTGTKVDLNQEILEIETDKVNQSIYASTSGVIQVFVQVGEAVQIGQIVASIESEKISEKDSSTPMQSQPAVIKEKEAISPKETSSVSSEIKNTESIKNKEEAQEQKEKAMSSKGEQRENRQPLSTFRKALAEKLREAHQNTAALTTFNELDLTEVLNIRMTHQEFFQKKYGTKLGLLPFFIKATLSALREFPLLNAYLEKDTIVQRNYYNIGVAVETPRGLVVPVLKNCDHLSFSDLEHAIHAFAKKGEEGTLALDDLQEGGFTITNGGIYGSLLSTPLLSPFQSGILGLHKIEKRAVVIEGEVVVRSMMYVALTYDHCLIDGKTAISFLLHIKNDLEDPSRLWLEN